MTTARRNHGVHKKRHGQHQKRTTHFMKVYKPFLPLLTLVVLVGLVAVPYINNRSGAASSQGTSPQSRQVLAYATDINPAGLLAATNQRRAQHGFAALAGNSQLGQAAQAKANDMATRNYWSHNTPDGVQPWVFISNAGYSYTRAGENLACGFNESGAVITGWFNSPSHRENMLGAEYKDVGFGIVNAPAYNCGDFPTSQQTIVVAMYGTPQAAANPTPHTPAAQTPAPATQRPTTQGVQQTVGDAPQSSQEVRHTVTLTTSDTDGQPVENVTVTIISESMTAKTNKDGQVVFSDVKTGSHKVSLEISGAKSEVTIDLTNQPAEYSETLAAPQLTSNQVVVDLPDESPAVTQKKVNRADLLISNFAVEIVWILTIAVLAGGGYALAKYSVAAHKFFVKGEKYILKHKYVDAAVILLLIALYLLTRNVGAIL